MSWPIYVDSNGGNIGRFIWTNSDIRCVASSWVFWGFCLWDTVNERSLPLPEVSNG